MALIPIAGINPIIDADYRYKMPRLLAKVEGRGNGVKTVVVNMKEVADALHRSAGEITKFFGCELGAQTSWKDDTEKSIVNGNHTAQMLQQQLARYIQGFVLCERCQLPETTYRIKGGVIYQKCDACGEKSMVDMAHKLTTYILNSHKKSDGDKKDKKKKDKEKEKERGSDENGSVEKKEKKEKKKDKDKKDKKKKDKKKSSEDGELNGHAGSAEEDSLKKSSSEDEDDDDVPTDENVAVEDAAAFEWGVERLKQFFADQPSATPQEILDELRTVSTFSALPIEERMFLFANAAFGADFAKANAVARYKGVLEGLILSVDAAAYQRRLIGVVEYLCSVRYPELMKWFPLVLKQLYDEDLVEEELFLEWHEEPGVTEFTRKEVTEEMARALHAQATKFITWLKEAETDEEDDDDDDEEDEEEA